jgi:hypothetical protein
VFVDRPRRSGKRQVDVAKSKLIVLGFCHHSGSQGLLKMLKVWVIQGSVNAMLLFWKTLVLFWLHAVNFTGSNGHRSHIGFQFSSRLLNT